MLLPGLIQFVASEGNGADAIPASWKLAGFAVAARFQLADAGRVRA
jgi:hypothetical protein